VAQRVRNLLGDGNEVEELIGADGVVEGVGCGHSADQDEHDETHALLSVVRAVREADTAAGADEKTADPEGWRLVVFGGLIKLRVGDDTLHDPKQNEGPGEADDG